MKLMNKAQTHNYIPFKNSDVTTLIVDLPEIHEGASKWIRAFEEATADRGLALGCMKAVWAQTLGVSAMENMLKQRF